MSVVPVTLRDSFFSDKFFQSSWEDFDKIKRDMLKESREFWERAERSREQMMKSMESSSSNNMSSSSNNMSSSSNNMSSSVQSSTSDRKSSREEQKSDNVRDIMTKDMMSLDKDDFFAPWFFPRRWMIPSMMTDNMTKDMTTTTESSSSNNKRMLFPSDFFSSLNQDEQVIRTKDDSTKFEVSLDTHDYRPEEVKVNIVGNVVSVEGKHEEKGEGKFVSRQFSRKYTLPEGCEAGRVTSNLSSDGILMITAPKKEVKRVENGQRAVPITMKN